MDNFQPHFSYVASLPENALTTKKWTVMYAVLLWNLWVALKRAG